jgi:hypothetical protein
MSVETTNKLGEAKMVRFYEDDEEALAQLKRNSKLPASEIVRRACAWAFPKFLAGELPLVSAENPESSNETQSQASEVGS